MPPTALWEKRARQYLRYWDAIAGQPQHAHHRYFHREHWRLARAMCGAAEKGYAAELFPDEDAFEPNWAAPDMPRSFPSFLAHFRAQMARWVREHGDPPGADDWELELESGGGGGLVCPGWFQDSEGGNRLPDGVLGDEGRAPEDHGDGEEAAAVVGRQPAVDGGTSDTRPPALEGTDSAAPAQPPDSPQHAVQAVAASPGRDEGTAATAGPRRGHDRSSSLHSTRTVVSGTNIKPLRLVERVQQGLSALDLTSTTRAHRRRRSEPATTPAATATAPDSPRVPGAFVAADVDNPTPYQQERRGNVGGEEEEEEAGVDGSGLRTRRQGEPPSNQQAPAAAADHRSSAPQPPLSPPPPPPPRDRERVATTSAERNAKYPRAVRQWWDWYRNTNGRRNGWLLSALEPGQDPTTMGKPR